MMLVGLTGGIGSGKTTVARMFIDLGIPVFFADDEAKRLMRKSKIVKRKLIKLFGEKAYENNELNKPYLASMIFNDQELLQKMNAIIHPKVAKRLIRWQEKQTTPYAIAEVAILFENGSYVNYDSIITVTASEEKRIERVMKRDGSSKKKIKAIMKNQWTDEDKIKLSDHVIYNDDLEEVLKQVKSLHKKLVRKSEKH